MPEPCKRCDTERVSRRAFRRARRPYWEAVTSSKHDSKAIDSAMRVSDKAVESAKRVYKKALKSAGPHTCGGDA